MSVKEWLSYRKMIQLDDTAGQLNDTSNEIGSMTSHLSFNWLVLPCIYRVE